MPGITQHQDRLAKGQKVFGHWLAHHRHLVEHQEIGIAQIGLRVQHELRLMNVVQPELQLRNLRLGKAALGHAHAGQIPLERRQLLCHAGDLLGRGLRIAVDQTVDCLCRRAFARHHVDRLAREGGKEHTTQTARRHGLETKRLDRQGGDGALSHPCIPKDPEDLLFVCAVAIPVADGGNGARLCCREGDAHALSSQQRLANGQKRQR